MPEGSRRNMKNYDYHESMTLAAHHLGKTKNSYNFQFIVGTFLILQNIFSFFETIKVYCKTDTIHHGSHSFSDIRGNHLFAKLHQFFGNQGAQMEGSRSLFSLLRIYFQFDLDFLAAQRSPSMAASLQEAINCHALFVRSYDLRVVV
jgi:hypothetical protein